MNTYYVYEHWRPDTNSCFYVGKGKGRRARVQKRNNPKYANIVNKLKRLGVDLEIRIVSRELTEAAAFEVEKARIQHWRGIGIDLANLTDGGEGPSGFKRTAEHTEKLLAAVRGRTVSRETREKIRAALIGHGVSVDARAKIRSSAVHPSGCGCFGCQVIRQAFLDRIRRLKEDEPLGSC